MAAYQRLDEGEPHSDQCTGKQLARGTSWSSWRNGQLKWGLLGPSARMEFVDEAHYGAVTVNPRAGKDPSVELGDIVTFGDFRQFVLLLAARDGAAYPGTLEEYLGGFLSLVIAHASDPPTYSLFALLLRDACSTPALPFDA